MKLNNRRLMRMMRENPYTVQPKKKAEMLAFTRTYDEKKQTFGGWNMKRITSKRIRPLLILATILSVMAVAVTAGLVRNYYQMPDGTIADESGNIIDPALLESNEDFALKMTGEPIVGDDYTIISVSWLRVNGNTTLSVWATSDSVELEGLSVVLDEAQYPVTNTLYDYDGYIGYTAFDIPNPTGMKLICKKPEFSYDISFENDRVSEECYSNGITLSGYVENEKIYIRFTDQALAETELLRNADVAYNTGFAVAYDNFGNEYQQKGSYHYDNVYYGNYVDFRTGNVYVPVYTKVHFPELIMTYYFDTLDSDLLPAVRIPVPEKGSSLTGNWILLDADGFHYEINSITHEENGDIRLESDCGVEYTGEYSISDVLNVQLAVNGRIISQQGNTSRVILDFFSENDSVENYLTQDNALEISLAHMMLEYSGEWTLTFPEN